MRGRRGKLGGCVSALGAGGLGERERVGQVVDAHESHLLRGWLGKEGCALGGGLGRADMAASADASSSAAVSARLAQADSESASASVGSSTRTSHTC